MNLARCLVAIAIAGIGLPCRAQSRPTPELPVSRIVLFSSGVGYFQRDGQVDGNAKVDLKFQTDDINDLLKSLVVQDLHGGKVGAVSYDNRDPLEHTLKAFAIDLRENPSLGKLLQQVRGERIAITGQDEKGGAFQAEGPIVGVESQTFKEVGKAAQVKVNERLTLFADQGLESHLLRNIQRIRFLKPELEADFKKALQVLAAGHDREKKAVTLNFLGNGSRKVRVGYVAEAPIWKTSYRLSLDREADKDKTFLQGWAIVENTTDEDWTNVRLGLVSGRPVSFRMDLYEPLFLARPALQLELFSSLVAPLHGRPGVPANNPAGGNGSGNSEPVSGRTYLQPSGAGGALGGLGGLGGLGAPSGGPGLPQGSKKSSDLDFRSSVVNAAIATELGEYFKYEIEHPVTLARQKSSLLPIVQGPVEASKLSIFNAAVQPKFPLLGLRLKNTTGLHLMQGPITVFEGGVYAGDARTGDLLPKETRLISYAVDLGTEVSTESIQGGEELVSVKLIKGMVHAARKARFTERYTISNHSDHERNILIEHPILTADLKLISPEKSLERTQDLYHFEVKVKAHGQASLDVVEEVKKSEAIALTNLNDQKVGLFLKQAVLSPQVKAAFQTAIRLKGELEATRQEIQNENNALKAIEQDQARMRANMERVPQTSEAYKRYLKKFDEQETEIEKRRAAVTDLVRKSSDQNVALTTFLADLNVE